MERVWVRGKPSERVIESGEVHYFYWKLELGLTHVQVPIRGKRRKIPVFFLKAHDYEPVKRLADKVVSRYHYRFIVHYKQPKIVKERPVVQFVTGAHVPIVSSSGPKRIHSDLDMANLTFEETYSIPILLNLLKSNSWAPVHEKELTDYEPKLEAIPEGVELVLASPHQVEVS